MILIILSSIFGLLILIALGGYFFPKTVNIEKSISIKANSDLIWAQISELENFKIWNPWAKKDPNMTVTISGSGIGSKYEWNGNKEVRSGSLSITNLEEKEKVELELFFGKNPKPSHTSMIMEQQDGKIKVSWTMTSDLGSNPANRYMGLFMEKFVGKDYENGLENLKSICESN